MTELQTGIISFENTVGKRVCSMSMSQTAGLYNSLLLCTSKIFHKGSDKHTDKGRPLVWNRKKKKILKLVMLDWITARSYMYISPRSVTLKLLVFVFHCVPFCLFVKASINTPDALNIFMLLTSVVVHPTLHGKYNNQYKEHKWMNIFC